MVRVYLNDKTFYDSSLKSHELKLSQFVISVITVDESLYSLIFDYFKKWVSLAVFVLGVDLRTILSVIGFIILDVNGVEYFGARDVYKLLTLTPTYFKCYIALVILYLF